MREIGKKYILAISFIFLIGISISLAEYYSLPMAVALALVSTVLAILVPWVIISTVSKKEFRYSTVSAFLLASLWEFFCSYLTRMLSYPLWKFFFNAGIGGIVVTAIIAIGSMIKAKDISAEVK
ncbi:hypothetical protein PFDSM3638_09260 [Pyrococcus furiosus DSM 3638]|uniref:Uncharacterized protein n=3 Tax=Pyrococcus furiosus TaxID=2261 RepID=Q8TZY4_PYRFU|nr:MULTISPECIES: hypothetical protein [Pyrococcus]AAL81965.1 hypothetical protein PF1841 [Pyrococcus furiosus DSM 3638]AFN04800.1 hypothetical protein PFC_09385 [Pyrococcus furiosus COM1]MDK2869545.1 hypothetical protein [Pyrococcus sp.]QEK79442.1 hypothetical protein PFDSM3638_09260 [Pyrococcus furiosus DSM 3638]